MKKLLFDLIASQPNAEGDFHGGGKYAKKVFLSLLEDSEFSVDGFYCFYDSKLSLDGEIRDQISFRKLMLIDVNNLSIREAVRDFGIETVYSALPGGYMDKVIQEKPCRVISTIHGLRFIETKLTFSSLKYADGIQWVKLFAKVVFANLVNRKYKNYYRNLIENTDVITVSNHTKYSLISYFYSLTINTDIKVFYSPDVTEFSPNDTSHLKFDLSNYFLLVSGNRWIKNNLNSLLAMDELFSENTSLTQKVVVTGVKHPSIFTKRLKNPERFVFLGYVEESYLRMLYSNAYALIYMSLNEGFGYPPLEAMKFGVPVIACSFTAISEICGDSALYANPYSIKEIKNRVCWLLADKDKYQELKELSLSRFSLISSKQKSDLLNLIKHITE